MSTLTTSRSFDPFRVLSKKERANHLEAYLAYLSERDGEIDLENHRLSRREAWFDDINRKAVEWSGERDLAGFWQHYRRDGSPEINPRTVWLVAAAMANLGEAYGVNIQFRRYKRNPESANREDPRYLYLMLEELYHTRILRTLCQTCGIEPESRPPTWMQRIMIHLMMSVPDRVGSIPILAGEILGTEVFKLLREGAEIFSEEPEVQERLESLLREIWKDEVFHVAYLRAKVGPLGIRMARIVLPLVVWWGLRDVPQLQRLGWTRKEVMQRIRKGVEIPPETDWMEPDPT